MPGFPAASRTAAVIAVLFFCGLTPRISSSADLIAVRAGSFQEQERAARAVDELKKKGIDCGIQKTDSLYVVLCGRFAGHTEARSLQQRLAVSGYDEAVIVPADGLAGETAVEPARTAPEQPPPGTRPADSRALTGDIFEKKKRNFHLYLGVAESYSDNIFNTRDDRKADFSTVLSPGISFNIPGVKENWRLTSIETANITPGGSALTRFLTRYPGRLVASLSYRAEIEQFMKYSSGNTTSHIAEGFFQYNFRGGLSVDIQDQFMRSHNRRGTGIFFTLDRFNSNFFAAVLSYETSDRMLLRLDLSNFAAHYLASRNDFRDRTDNSASAFVFYKVASKTALFVQYEFLDIRYDEHVLSNSREQHVFAGLRWDITARTKGSVKAGYGTKDFSAAGMRNTKDFLAEAQVEYFFTPKTSVSLVASRRTNESDVSAANFIVSDSARTTYTQRFTKKVNGSVRLSWQKDRYNGDVTIGAETKRLVEKYAEAAVALQYEFREWLKFDVGFARTRRTSSFSELDYTTNTVYFKVASFF